MIVIERASEQDTAIIEDILSDTVAWRNNTDKPMWTAEQITWKRLSSDYCVSDFYIAYINRVPAGCVALTDYADYWADIPKGESLFIHKLAVKRFAAAKGVSDALILYAKSMCLDKGLSTLRLGCPQDRPKLRAVYERNSFVFVMERVTYGKYPTAFCRCDIHE